MKNIIIVVSFLAGFMPIYSQSLTSIESVEYDASQNRFLVSNSSSIIARNTDGSLEYFGNGAASYGMEVLGENIFVIQGSSVRAYNLETELQVMSISIPGASFLNGMTNDGVENIYVTDFGANKIHRVNVADISNPTTELVVASTGSTPNGIVYDEVNDRLIFVSWGSNAKVKAVDLSNNSVSTLTTTPYSNIDGIDEDNDGNYYISYWSSGTRISKYDADFVNAPEVITVSGLSSPADICYAKEIDSLAIPHSGNQLTFINFSTVDIKEFKKGELNFSVSSNPIGNNSRLTFSLDKTTSVSLVIYNNQGKLVHEVMSGRESAGNHQVVLSELQMSAGHYVATITVGGISESLQLIVE